MPSKDLLIPLLPSSEVRPSWQSRSDEDIWRDTSELQPDIAYWCRTNLGPVEVVNGQGTAVGGDTPPVLVDGDTYSLRVSSKADRRAFLQRWREGGGDRSMGLAHNDASIPAVRVSRLLLEAVQVEAKLRDETVSQVVRRALRAYLQSKPTP